MCKENGDFTYVSRAVDVMRYGKTHRDKNVTGSYWNAIQNRNARADENRGGGRRKGKK